MLSICLGNRDIQVTAVPLTQAAFSPFGDVVSNPRPDIHPQAFAQHSQSLPPNASSANQGSAIKYFNVSHISNLYDQAPSRKSEPVMSIFSCASRPLAPDGRLNCPILERHPFTSQTFTPILSKASRYLVIVASSLLPSRQDEDLFPAPRKSLLLSSRYQHPGQGLPDVNRLQAFVATSAQAVTYGAGTWHSPMVALGEPGETLDFVVSQFVSGVEEEDCQLVQFASEGMAEPRVTVRIDTIEQLSSKL